MREHIFCAQCGARLTSQPVDGQIRPFCTDCGTVVYLNPLPAVAAVLLRNGRVLLIKRGVEPGRDLWALPSGFMEQHETPEQTLVREVAEETAIVCRSGALLAAQTHHDRVFGHVLVLAYAAAYLSGDPLAGDDASAVSWFDTKHLPSMAFRSHIDFILLAEQLLECNE